MYMTNNQHTPGPWEIKQTFDRWAVYGPQHTVMVVSDRGLIPMPQDARLIACAPDLLAVAQKAACYLEGIAPTADNADLRAELIAVIEKATGRKV
jgi:hypothetical protein